MRWVYSVAGTLSFLSATSFLIQGIVVSLSHGANAIGDPVMAAGFVQRDGTQLFLDGKPYYINGWNSYWFMAQAVEETTRKRVSSMLKLGASMGLNVCRTWAFNDASHQALQISPGNYNESVFQALDFVIAEAQKNGVKLMLSLVNNMADYGGKGQYVAWARAAGVQDVLQGLNTNDSFYINPTIRDYYKSHVTTVLTRVNSINKVQYRDDPTIFAWELINEAQCAVDPSGHALQAWIEEMASHVKAVDKKHLLTVGLEGFYAQDTVGRGKAHPSFNAPLTGTDFIRNHQAPGVDFASVHVYPDHWIPWEQMAEKMKFFEKWMTVHIEDAAQHLKQPVLFSEFGLSDRQPGFDIKHRDAMFKAAYDKIYRSAKENGAGAGAIAWHFLDKELVGWDDGYAVYPLESPSTIKVMTAQSCRLRTLLDSTIQSNDELSKCEYGIT